nr:MAG TPA: hypothetical protein [Caudoviricetes sp.]
MCFYLPQLTAAGFYRSVADLSFIINFLLLMSPCRDAGAFLLPKTKRMRGGGDGKAEKPKPG